MQARPNKIELCYALLLAVGLCVLPHYGKAQTRLFSTRLGVAERQLLLAKEDTLKDYAEYLTTDSLPEDRMIADSVFTKTLVRALRIDNSFWFAFDSVKGISCRYAPDSSFRIITWNLQFDDYYARQKGAIQKRTENGSLSLYPLRDVSEFTDHPEDSLRSANQWIGALYYNIILTSYQDKNYYTLFGFDPNNARSSIKWLDVLQFNAKGEPVFGGPFFTYDKDSIPTPPRHRVALEFKKGARVLMDYVAELDMILVDHLISENNDPDSKYTYIPDGDQEGFKWTNGKWVHINKVFTLQLQDGQAPREQPLFDKPKPPAKLPNQQTGKGKG
jgi:hypothetical protein